MMDVSNRHFFMLVTFTISLGVFALPPEVQTTEIKQACKKNESTLLIKNAITPEMLTYEHWSGKHQPENFCIEIDGQAIETGQEAQLTLQNKNTIEIVYKYSFAKGLYKGTRSCTIPVPENISQGSLAFSWKENPRMWLEMCSERAAC